MKETIENYCSCPQSFNSDDNFLNCKNCRELIHSDCLSYLESKKCCKCGSSLVAVSSNVSAKNSPPTENTTRTKNQFLQNKRKAELGLSDENASSNKRNKFDTNNNLTCSFPTFSDQTDSLPKFLIQISDLNSNLAQPQDENYIPSNVQIDSNVEKDNNYKDQQYNSILEKEDNSKDKQNDLIIEEDNDSKQQMSSLKEIEKKYLNLVEAYDSMLKNVKAEINYQERQIIPHESMILKPMDIEEMIFFKLLEGMENEEFEEKITSHVKFSDTQKLSEKQIQESTDPKKYNVYDVIRNYYKIIKSYQQKYSIARLNNLRRDLDTYINSQIFPQKLDSFDSVTNDNIDYSSFIFPNQPDDIKGLTMKLNRNFFTLVSTIRINGHEEDTNIPKFNSSTCSHVLVMLNNKTYALMSLIKKCLNNNNTRIKFMCFTGPSGCGKSHAFLAIYDFIKRDESRIILYTYKVQTGKPFHSLLVKSAQECFPDDDIGDFLEFSLLCVHLKKKLESNKIVGKKMLLIADGFNNLKEYEKEQLIELRDCFDLIIIISSAKDKEYTDISTQKSSSKAFYITHLFDEAEIIKLAMLKHLSQLLNIPTTDTQLMNEFITEIGKLILYKNPLVVSLYLLYTKGVFEYKVSEIIKSFIDKFYLNTRDDLIMDLANLIYYKLDVDEDIREETFSCKWDRILDQRVMRIEQREGGQLFLKSSLPGVKNLIILLMREKFKMEKEDLFPNLEKLLTNPALSSSAKGGIFQLLVEEFLLLKTPFTIGDTELKVESLKKMTDYKQFFKQIQLISEKITENQSRSLEKKYLLSTLFLFQECSKSIDFILCYYKEPRFVINFCQITISPQHIRTDIHFCQDDAYQLHAENKDFINNFVWVIGTYNNEASYDKNFETLLNKKKSIKTYDQVEMWLYDKRSLKLKSTTKILSNLERTNSSLSLLLNKNI
jgi:hypothetical protein